MVDSRISYTLGSYVENLTLNSLAGNINGIGNNLANTIIGNAGANRIDGGTQDDDLFGGSGADTLIGGSGYDELFGGDGNDILRGGANNDWLEGGAGQDQFRFDTALGSGNIDEILDFAVIDDTIALSQSVFSAITAAGTLTAAAFRAGTAAQDADDRIIYDQAAGKLYYDADGNGAGAMIQFAQIDPGTELTNADFFLI